MSLAGLRHEFHSLALPAALRGAEDPAADSTTLRVRTPEGGMRTWYATSPEQGWRCSSGSGTGQALSWHIDVHAHGGYVVAPGTRTAAGAYRAVGPARRPAELPMWLAAEPARTGHRPSTALPWQAGVPWRARRAAGERT
ncbi:bifunctional DNA primase/polymerase [Streptomyces luteolifulvus]|uniref:bifunctional DNA primase/polymerase n=1 Tax=Streptomyces luteolifulvus TaxID=2615112 RepID=UPI001CD9CD7B|nr:bifunctional DNA primase/polymerase [Streptomyces luteolifulvus]